ncbi:MAG: SurA N-terminal domain-containing protein [Bacteroidales bacterium]|nr:SurA N-terminal domain-containing protein [Bacteroidales bacterium]
MAVLEKIRVKFGLAISIIIALALLSFIIDPSTLESALHSMSSKYDVGRIDGKSISYTDFQEEVDKYTAINELLSGSSVQNEESQKQIRNAAWQGLLDKYMFIKNAKAAGINVGEEEMLSLTTGDNISPVLIQSGVFSDENGNFSPEALVDFVKQVDADETGRLRNYWNYLQNTIYTQQFYTKYGSLFTNGELANVLEIEDLMALNNTTVDFDYVQVSYPYVRDTTITATSKEINDFYKAHKNFFKQEANRDIEYVVFEVVPSEKDIMDANDAVASVYEEFGTTDNMKAFLLKNSDRSLSNYWYKAGELNTICAGLDDELFAQGKEVSSIIQEGNTFYAARTIASEMVPDSVYVKHILLQNAGAQALADSLVGVIAKGENFANLAAEFSVDQNSADGGVIGNIGWMTQTYTIPGFESTITAEVNKPFVLKTQYGTHVVLVSEKTKPIAKKQVAVLEKEALASKETFNNYYSQANNFASIANGTYEGYQRALDSTKVYSHAQNITEATSNYGSIDQAKEVTRWAFDAKAGKASNIITVNNNFFFVVALKDIHKEGYAPVSEVSRAINETLYSQKLREKVTSETAAKISGLTSIESIAEALGTEVESLVGASLASSQFDPALIGAISATEVGKLSNAVKGSLAVYVVKVNDKQVGSFYTEEDAKNYAFQKAQYTSQQVMSVMMDKGDVKDNRERFF